MIGARLTSLTCRDCGDVVDTTSLPAVCSCGHVQIVEMGDLREVTAKILNNAALELSES